MTMEQEFYAYYKTLPIQDLDRRLSLIKTQLLPAVQNKRAQVQQFYADALEALQQARAEREAS
jgi:hypothetical protein